MFNAIILIIFTYKMIPETKGKTLEEIGKMWIK
jgi:SP family arabinose:H+ symporter-like MFS transporter